MRKYIKSNSYLGKKDDALNEVLREIIKDKYVCDDIYSFYGMIWYMAGIADVGQVQIGDCSGAETVEDALCLIVKYCDNWWQNQYGTGNWNNVYVDLEAVYMEENGISDVDELTPEDIEVINENVDRVFEDIQVGLDEIAELIVAYIEKNHKS